MAAPAADPQPTVPDDIIGDPIDLSAPLARFGDALFDLFVVPTALVANGWSLGQVSIECPKHGIDDKLPFCTR